MSLEMGPERTAGPPVGSRRQRQRQETFREIVTTAQKATRKARRDADRRQHLKTSEPPAKPIPPDVDMADPQADNLPPAKPFDQIEEW